MIWKNLQENKCPSCNKLFGIEAISTRKDYIVCPKCHFTIRISRFEEIVHSKITKELEEKWESEAVIDY